MNNRNRMPDELKEQILSHLDRLAAKTHLSKDDRIAYDRAVDRYSVSRIVEKRIGSLGKLIVINATGSNGICLSS